MQLCFICQTFYTHNISEVNNDLKCGFQNFAPGGYKYNNIGVITDNHWRHRNDALCLKPITNVFFSTYNNYLVRFWGTRSNIKKEKRPNYSRRILEARNSLNYLSCFLHICDLNSNKSVCKQETIVSLPIIRRNNSHSSIQ